MKFIKPLLKYLILLVIAVAPIMCLTAQRSYADGFPVRPGRLMLSPSVNYFFANQEWDSTSVKKPFPDNGQFTSLSISMGMEYGISRRFTAVALVPYVINNFRQTGYNVTFSGLTDVEAGIKYYLANINYVYYFSIQATGIEPTYKNPAMGPDLGYGEQGAELKLSTAGSGNLFDRNFYFNIEDGFRQYFGPSGPYQDRYNGTFGLTLDRKFKEQVSVSIGGFYTFSNYKLFNKFNPSATKNFAFKQASLTYGHSFSRQVSVFLTAGHFIAGRNTGDGSSASISLVYRIGN